MTASLTCVVWDPQLEAMQQYSVAPLGYAPLQRWAEAHTRALHSPPARVPLKTTITGGANQSLEVCGTSHSLSTRQCALLC